MINKIYNMDCLEGMKKLPDQCINTCVTSPPYYGLRDYGVNGQIGLETTPDEYVTKLVEVFREVRRVLRDDGTLWLNLGDSYAGGKMKDCSKSDLTWSNESSRIPPVGLKPKDLVGIPWRVAFALQADGWYLRSDIIWHKPNPMPESVTDRPTKAHEYLFLLSKSERYYYDREAIKEPASMSSVDRCSQNIEKQDGSARGNGGAKTNGPMKAVGGPKKDKQRGHGRRHAGFNERWDEMSKEEQCSIGRNKRTVWTVATKPFAEAHFATFPPDLIKPCILAGCPEGGVVLDPFMGAGTTAVTALELHRKYIGFELNSEYINITGRRVAEFQRRKDSLGIPMFGEEASQ